MLDLAKPIVDQKSGFLEPDKFENQYETALVELIDQKRAGKPIVPKERPRGENVVDLMDALRKSIGGAAAETKAAQKPTKKPKKAAAGQKRADCDSELAKLRLVHLFYLRVHKSTAGRESSSTFAAARPPAKSSRGDDLLGRLLSRVVGARAAREHPCQRHQDRKIIRSS
ncbi:hypothetical protein ACVWZR_001949 [Bradyrhizobium sp. i1.3.1]